MAHQTRSDYSTANSDPRDLACCTAPLIAQAQGVIILLLSYPTVIFLLLLTHAHSSHFRSLWLLLLFPVLRALQVPPSSSLKPPIISTTGRRRCPSVVPLVLG